MLHNRLPTRRLCIHRYRKLILLADWFPIIYVSKSGAKYAYDYDKDPSHPSTYPAAFIVVSTLITQPSACIAVLAGLPAMIGRWTILFFENCNSRIDDMAMKCWNCSISVFLISKKWSCLMGSFDRGWILFYRQRRTAMEYVCTAYLINTMHSSKTQLTVVILPSNNNKKYPAC